MVLMERAQIQSIKYSMIPSSIQMHLSKRTRTSFRMDLALLKFQEGLSNQVLQDPPRKVLESLLKQDLDRLK